jgi:hypothetical protein
MNILLILSTLVIGAASGGDSSSTQISPPTADFPLPPIQNNSNATKPKPKSPMKEAQELNERQKKDRGLRTSGYSGRSQQQYGQGSGTLMPMAPTDSSAGSQLGQNYQFLPPTANASVGDANGARSSGMYGPTVPGSPTRARPGEPQSYSSMQNVEQQTRRQAAARSAATAPPQLAPKPFSGAAQTSASGISPYMNLFRTGSNNGTIDNYSTLVRPELDQRRANQKFGADIHGLENSTHVQGLNIQQLNRDTQNLQGVNATQYFMNYGDFYQGAR